MRRALALLIVSSCCVGCMIKAPLGTKGNGNIISESREIAEFHELAVQGAFEVRLKEGEPGSLQLTGDENLLPLVESSVADGRLVVKIAQGESISPTKGLVIELAAPKLAKVEILGASGIEGPLDAADTFALVLKGASQAELRGKTGSLKLDVEGASRVRLDGLEAESIDVDIEGASSAQVHASNRVHGKVEGASQLKIGGEATDIQVKTSGVSSVQKPGAKPSR